ncbi:MAG TPA: helix-turn-helix transcriptional regulator [Pirellulales bacterium]|nr:helix-turn-helix transcriptional regulator [Pirellulales bacterium]
MLDWIAAGKRLREKRIARGVGLREGAEVMGVLPSLLSSIENGRVDPSRYEVNWTTMQCYEISSHEADQDG